MGELEDAGLEGTSGEPWRERVGLILAPLVFAGLWLAPLELETPAHRLAAIMGAVIVLWVTEAIPMAMTAFLGVASAVALGVAPAAVAFAPFADPLIFLFVGTFMLAQSIFFHGLDRRFAFAILSLPGVGDRPGRVLVAYAAVACAISMWISNTATTAMMFPIGISLLAALEARGDGAALPAGFGTALLLSNSFAASVGGLGTPVGTPPNLIGIGFIRRELGVELPFFSWMALGVPVVLALLAFLLFDLARSGAPPGTRLTGVTELLSRERAKLGAWSRGEKNTLFAFAATVFFWVLPGLVALFAGEDAPAYRELSAALPESVVALFGAALLFVLPTNLARHEFTLPWREAVKIDWWIVFLYGGGIALGTLAFKTGLADALGRSLTSLLGLHSSLGPDRAVDRAGGRPLRDHQQHRRREHGRAGDDRGRALRRRRPRAAGAGRDDGLVAGLHAAGLDALQRDRLRLGPHPAHPDDAPRDRPGPGRDRRDRPGREPARSLGPETLRD